MEELTFKLGNSSISFRAQPPSAILPWPVPRQGEYVQARTTAEGQNRSLGGMVASVTYYYSTGNNGPVVTVVLS